MSFGHHKFTNISILFRFCTLHKSATPGYQHTGLQSPYIHTYTRTRSYVITNSTLLRFSELFLTQRRRDVHIRYSVISYIFYIHCITSDRLCYSPHFNTQTHVPKKRSYCACVVPAILFMVGWSYPYAWHLPSNRSQLLFGKTRTLISTAFRTHKHILLSFISQCLCINKCSAKSMFLSVCVCGKTNYKQFSTI